MSRNVKEKIQNGESLTNDEVQYALDRGITVPEQFLKSFRKIHPESEPVESTAQSEEFTKEGLNELKKDDLETIASDKFDLEFDSRMKKNEMINSILAEQRKRGD